MKTFETHLELIFEVLARVGSVVTGLLCLEAHPTQGGCVGTWASGVGLEDIYWATCQVPPAPATLHVVATWGLSQCHPEPNS